MHAHVYIASISYYHDIVLTITIMITIGYHDNSTIVELYFFPLEHIHSFLLYCACIHIRTLLTSVVLSTEGRESAEET